MAKDMDQQPLGPGSDIDEVLRALRSGHEESPPTETEARMRQALEGFRQDLREHPYVQKIEAGRLRRQWKRPRWSRPARWALAIGSSAAAAVLIIVALLFFTTNTGWAMTWQEVVERFRSVTFFNATIYVKDSALGQPEERELWMGHGGRLRMRMGSVVIFARNGKVEKAFDIRSRAETAPDGRTIQLLEKFGSQPEFSLDVVLNCITGGRVFETTPVVNTEAMISKDLAVFDIQSPKTPEWMRVWTLAESKLPVRMQLWDPRSGASVDAWFTYSKDQPDAFFDPKAFEEQLRSSTLGAANAAYATLIDPGRRAITPADLYKQEAGYHLPTLESIGMTSDGAVWVVAARSLNRKPNGAVFFGFGALADDLGRSYIRVAGSHQTEEDRSLEIFVPEDYPFDPRVPHRLTVTGIVASDDKSGAPEVIGKVEVVDWKRDARWPADLRATEPLIGQAQRLLEAAAWDKLDRLLAAIPGEPEDSAVALDREGMRLAKQTKQGAFADAARLGGRLMPLLEKEYQNWGGYPKSPAIFNDYIVALAGSGQVAEAGELLRRIERIVPIVPDHLPQLGQEHIARIRQQQFDQNLEVLAGRLYYSAKLSVETINMIVGSDVRKDERFKRCPAFQKP